MNAPPSAHTTPDGSPTTKSGNHEPYPAAHGAQQNKGPRAEVISSRESNTPPRGGMNQEGNLVSENGVHQMEEGPEDISLEQSRWEALQGAKARSIHVHRSENKPQVEAF